MQSLSFDNGMQPYFYNAFTNLLRTLGVSDTKDMWSMFAQFVYSLYMYAVPVVAILHQIIIMWIHKLLISR